MHAEGENNEVGWLLQELEDPFAIFPLQSVQRYLANLLATSEASLASRMGFYGVARKFMDVESEHLIAEAGLILGATFVLAQAALTQSISILSRLRVLCGRSSSIPESRARILEWHAPLEKQTGLSLLVIVDTAANYFKHHHEWPPKWSEHFSTVAHISPAQSRTMECAVQIGMLSVEVTDNLYIAFHQMRVDGAEEIDIGTVIQEWRFNIARKLYKALNRPDPELNFQDQ